MCDGKEDCLSGADESNCTSVHCDQMTDFACKDERQCIQSFLKCDGVQNCKDGSDELDCQTEEISKFDFSLIIVFI